MPLGQDRRPGDGEPACPARKSPAEFAHSFVHKPVDGLCKTASSLCTILGKRGITNGVHTYCRAATWENIIHTLCKVSASALSTRHAAIIVR